MERSALMRAVAFLLVSNFILSFTFETENVNRFITKRQIVTIEDDERWSWGVVDEDVNKRNQSITNRNLDQRNNDTENACNIQTRFQSEPMPDFSAPDRRISEQKCLEYIWRIKDREEKRKRRTACISYLNRFGDFVSVIGGHDAVPGDFPHLGAIGWKGVETNWTFICGSSLISPKFVLTAAHCTVVSPNYLYSQVADVVPKIVRFGTTDIVDGAHHNHSIDVNISKIIPHPEYQSPKRYYDIALMELEIEVTFNKYVQPACLWKNFDTNFLDNRANVTGWGVVKTGQLGAFPKLQVAELSIIDNKTCDQLLQPHWNRLWCGLKETQICAGNLTGGVDACNGDSGAPLQVRVNLPPSAEGTIHYVIGVTSFGFDCGLKNTPGVYTRVSEFLDWIEDIVWEKK